jgi:hypothetical protein
MALGVAATGITRYLVFRSISSRTERFKGELMATKRLPSSFLIEIKV